MSVCSTKNWIEIKKSKQVDSKKCVSIKQKDIWLAAGAYNMTQLEQYTWCVISQTARAGDCSLSSKQNTLRWNELWRMTADCCMT